MYLVIICASATKVNIVFFQKVCYINKSNIINKTKGRIIIKEFPAKKLSVRGIERLLEDLKLKENFIRDKTNS